MLAGFGAALLAISVALLFVGYVILMIAIAFAPVIGALAIVYWVLRKPAGS